MSQTAEATATGEDFIEDFDDRMAAANKIVRMHMYISAGCGVIPVPALDMLALSTVQMNMIRKISNLYDVPFSGNKVRNIITALVGSSAPIGIGSVIAKAVPIVGMMTMPALTGASTLALGKVIIQHLESGGTFLDLDPATARKNYKQELNNAKAKAKA